MLAEEKRIVRWIVGAFVILVGLAGCFRPPASSVPVVRTAGIPDSWFLPVAKADALLYVSSSTGDNTAGVDVFAYRGGVLRGKLAGFKDPRGLCVDRGGNIFVPDQLDDEIFEYSHGSAKPIATLHDVPYSGPADCSIDPTSGDLAVANLSTANYGIAIFKEAKGKPKVYTYGNYGDYFACGYDDSGNLFVGSLDGNWHFMLLEIPKGNTDFIKITLHKLPYEFSYTGGVKWDGKYVAVDDQGASTIYQIDVKGSVGTVVGSTRLAYGAESGAFWFPDLKFGENGREATRVLATVAGTDVDYWNYPTGGVPVEYVPVGNPLGVAVSPAKR